MDKKFFSPQIKILNTLIEKELDKHLMAQEAGFTSTQMSVVIYLFDHRDETIQQNDLDTEFRLSRPTINGIIKRLVEKDAIRLEKSPKDSRAKQIILQPRIIDDFKQHQSEFERDMTNLELRMFAGMNEQEIIQFKASIATIIKNMQ